jgi:CBS domain-containing protein/anti-sigma regulatory factor (Ser/Thr protein kinase)
MDTDITKIQELLYELRVGEVMTSDVIIVTPQTSMRDVQEILRVHRISGVPVMTDDKLVGIVSIMDLIQALESDQIDHPVGQWMTQQVQALYADEHVISAIQKLQQTGYGRFPVIDRTTNEMVGILTQGDIIKGALKRLDIDYRQREYAQYRPQQFFEDMRSEHTSIILRYAIKAQDFVHGGQASSQFKRSLRTLSILPDILRRVAVATYEAEMNLVLHTTDGGTIRAEIQEDRIRVDISDHGPGIPDVEQAMKPGFSTAPEWIREMGFGAGMGLTNIENCADEMRLRSQMGRGTHLRIWFRLNDSEG